MSHLISCNLVRKVDTPLRCDADCHRFLDVLWDDSRLYIVLEYLDVDLRQHMDLDKAAITPHNIRVSNLQKLSKTRLHSEVIL